MNVQLSVASTSRFGRVRGAASLIQEPMVNNVIKLTLHTPRVCLRDAGRKRSVVAVKTFIDAANCVWTVSSVQTGRIDTYSSKVCRSKESSIRFEKTDRCSTIV